MTTIERKRYIKCHECPLCKPQEGLRYGARWGICHIGGDIVYLEPHKEKRIKGSGYIEFQADSCCLWESAEEALKHK